MEILKAFFNHEIKTTSRRVSTTKSCLKNSKKNPIHEPARCQQSSFWDGTFNWVAWFFENKNSCIFKFINSYSVRQNWVINDNRSSPLIFFCRYFFTTTRDSFQRLQYVIEYSIRDQSHIHSLEAKLFRSVLKILRRPPFLPSKRELSRKERARLPKSPVHAFLI